MNKTAQMVMRAYGDRVGRNRLKSDSTLMLSKPPRGNAIITGEYPPDISESGTARYIGIELSKTDINTTLLTELQEIAQNNCFKSVMSYYIRYTYMYVNSEPMKIRFCNSLKNIFIEKRLSFSIELENRKIDFHARIPEALAWIYIGFYSFITFISATEAISQSQCDELLIECEKILLQLAIKQSKSVTEDKPSIKFLTKLNSLLNSGTAKIFELKDSIYAGGDGFIGYSDDRYYYLFSDITHKMVRKLCDEQGESFSVSVKSLLKNLSDDNFIETDKEKNTKLLRVNGKLQRLVWLKKSALDIINE